MQRGARAGGGARHKKSDGGGKMSAADLEAAAGDLAELAGLAAHLMASLEAQVAASADALDALNATSKRLPVAEMERKLKALRKPDALYAFVERRYDPAPRPRSFMVLAPSSRPPALQALYDACDPGPDLSVFDTFTDPGSSQAKFSNPLFFREEWAKTEVANQAETEARLLEERRTRKKKKQREAVDAGSPPPPPVRASKPPPPPPPPRASTAVTDAPPPLPARMADSDGGAPAARSALNRPRRAPSMAASGAAPPPPMPPAPAPAPTPTRPRREHTPPLAAAVHPPPPPLRPLPPLPQAPPVAAAADAPLPVHASVETPALPRRERTRPPPPVRVVDAAAVVRPLPPPRPASLSAPMQPLAALADADDAVRSRPPPPPPQQRAPLVTPEQPPRVELDSVQPSPPAPVPAPRPVPPTRVPQSDENDEAVPPQPQGNGDPALAKFALMQKMNMPRGAIEQAMQRAGVDPALLFPDYAPAPAPALTRAVPPRAAAPVQRAASPRADMLAGIQMGQAQLKKAEPADDAKASPLPPRSGLMADILTAKLRKVSEEDRPKPKAPATAAAANTGLGDGNIASILARRIAIIGEAGEQSDSSDAGSEWDDD